MKDAPLRGARSIGISHPRSGDRCIAPHLSTTTPPGCRRAEHPFPATPGGVEAYCVCLYIGRRHFVPRPMPMERASYGCRREPGWRAGEGSRKERAEERGWRGSAREGVLVRESRGGSVGEGGLGGSARLPTRPTCPIRLTRPMTDSRSIPSEEITAICTAGHPPHRYYSDYPPRCGRAAAEGRGPAHREEVHLPPGICPV